MNMKMDLVVTTESRFVAGSDHCWRSVDGTAAYPFWQRYLDVFDRVIVVARCAAGSGSKGHPVTGPGVDVWPLSDAQGAWGAIRRWTLWQRQLEPLLRRRQVFSLRLPGQIGWLLGSQLRQRGIPFAVEAVGDPAAVFRRGTFRHPLRPGIQLCFRHVMRQLCHEAIGCSYVTESHLQSLYPPSHSSITTNYSSIELDESAFAGGPRDYFQRPLPMYLINVATMSQRYKGQQDLIDAVSACVAAGRCVRLALVGDGRFRPVLEAQVRQAGLTDSVRFLGALPSGNAVRQALDQADVFVLPSLTEGLPRALIEAQSRGLPCIATDVGGVSELIGTTELVAPRKPSQMAASLLNLLDDPHRLTRLSRENLARSRCYSSTVLRPRRSAFFQQICAEVAATSSFDRRRAG